MNEQGQTNAVGRWRLRSDTRRVATSTTVGDVDDGKILAVQPVSDVTLTFASAARCVGCAVHAIVTANPSARALAVAAQSPGELVLVGPAHVASAPVGTSVRAQCTGTRWHVEVGLPKPNGPLNMGGFRATALAAPATPLAAATRDYVDLAVAQPPPTKTYAFHNTTFNFDHRLNFPHAIIWGTRIITKGQRLPFGNIFSRAIFEVGSSGRFLVNWTVVRNPNPEPFVSWLWIEGTTQKHGLMVLQGARTSGSSCAVVHIEPIATSPGRFIILGQTFVPTGETLPPDISTTIDLTRL